MRATQTRAWTESVMQQAKEYTERKRQRGIAAASQRCCAHRMLAPAIRPCIKCLYELGAQQQKGERRL
eukprot:7169776-Prymnesium_polylepis.3